MNPALKKHDCHFRRITGQTERLNSVIAKYCDPQRSRIQYANTWWTNMTRDASTQISCWPPNLLRKIETKTKECRSDSYIFLSPFDIFLHYPYYMTTCCGPILLVPSLNTFKIPVNWAKLLDKFTGKYNGIQQKNSCLQCTMRVRIHHIHGFELKQGSSV